MAIEITGSDELIRYFQNAPDNVRVAARRTINNAADQIRDNAKRRIAGGPKTGRIYQKSATVTHQASAPGESPASDEGRLLGSIQSKHARGNSLTATAGTLVDYGLELEFGTRGFAARPWLGPASATVSANFDRRLRSAITRALNVR